jgi:hypothetical protein
MGVEPTIYRTRGEHDNHYVTNVVTREQTIYSSRGELVNPDIYWAVDSPQEAVSYQCVDIYFSV